MLFYRTCLPTFGPTSVPTAIGPRFLPARQPAAPHQTGINTYFVMTAPWAERFRTSSDKTVHTFANRCSFQCVIHGLYGALVDAQQTQNAEQKGDRTHGYEARREERKTD